MAPRLQNRGRCLRLLLQVNRCQAWSPSPRTLLLALQGAEASITLRPPSLDLRALTGASPHRRHRHASKDEETEAQVRQAPKAGR